MKRITGLLTTLLLSLTIVWMGAGITLLHCAHTGAVEVATAAEDDGCAPDAHQEKPCHPMSHMAKAGDCSRMPSCMSVEVLRLSPSTVSQSVRYIFGQTAVCLPPLVPVFADLLPADAGDSRTVVAESPWHSPPRHYLTLIRVLQI